MIIDIRIVVSAEVDGVVRRFFGFFDLLNGCDVFGNDNTTGFGRLLWNGMVWCWGDRYDTGANTTNVFEIAAIVATVAVVVAVRTIIARGVSCASFWWGWRYWGYTSDFGHTTISDIQVDKLLLLVIPFGIIGLLVVLLIGILFEVSGIDGGAAVRSGLNVQKWRLIWLAILGTRQFMIKLIGLFTIFSRCVAVRRRTWDLVQKLVSILCFECGVGFVSAVLRINYVIALGRGVSWVGCRALLVVWYVFVHNANGGG